MVDTSGVYFFSFGICQIPRWEGVMAMVFSGIASAILRDRFFGFVSQSASLMLRDIFCGRSNLLSDRKNQSIIHHIKDFVKSRIFNVSPLSRGTLK